MEKPNTYHAHPEALPQNGPLRPKKRRRRAVLLILLVLLLLGGSTAALWLLEKGPFAPAVPPAAYHAEGPVKALALPAPEGKVNESSLREYFRAALDFAQQNGYNTLVFDAKSDLNVWWRDKAFPTAPSATAQDGFFKKLDPLALLCEEAAGREIQLWLRADPYLATGAEETTKGKAAKLAAELPGSTFAADDATYREMLAKSLAALPQHYPLAGLVLDGFAVSAENPVSDTAAWQEGLLALVGELQAGWSTYPKAPGLHFSFPETSGLITPAFSARLLEAGAGYLLPESETPLDDASRLAAYGSQPQRVIVTPEPGAKNSALPLFLAAQQPYYAGVQLGVWPEAAAQSAPLALLETALARPEASLPPGFALPHSLAVNFPTAADSIDTTWEQVYVMGNSDPAQPLLLNGQEVPRRGSEGSFGVLVPLAYGENVLQFSQGETVLNHSITRPEPNQPAAPPPQAPLEDTEGGELPELPAPTHPADNTQEAMPGQAVQMNTVFTGGLTQPGEDAAINETYYQGAVGVVQQSVRTLRWDAARGVNVLSWSYLLTTGDYVNAQNCTWIPGDGAAVFTGLSAQADEAKRGEWIQFEGSGSPAAVISCEGGRLSLRMNSTSFTLPGPFSSRLVKSAEVETIDNGVVLHLETQNLWGYQIVYTEGGTRLFLKAAPSLSQNPAKPLEGVRVMLDPGHGGDDIGAPGMMGAAGPNEKDLNLAQAQAIQYRLLQLGAEVIMVREDTETFFTTQERLAQVMEEKPDFFLSVHHNSGAMTADQSGTEGMQIFYHLPSGYTAPRSAWFAQNLMDNAAACTGRGASAPGWGYYNVIRTPVCPAVLFEFAFVVSPADFESAASAEGLYRAAYGVADGLLASLPAA